ncbi:MAG: hypothetical protein M3R16_03630 [Pseudomonadota bacterium]|nr:hypothetical protein [Pseudomonadota bacterium]
MTRCSNTVAVTVPRGYTYATVQVRCGATGPSGDKMLCGVCTARAEEQYPQGWRHAAGDTCIHGTYLGCMEDNDETLCGRCESED